MTLAGAATTLGTQVSAHPKPPVAVLAGRDELATLSLTRALIAAGVTPLLLTGGRRTPLAARLAGAHAVLTPEPAEAEELREALASLGHVWRWRYGARPVLLATDAEGTGALAREYVGLAGLFIVPGDAGARDYRRFCSRDATLEALRGLNGRLALPRTFVCRRPADGEAIAAAVSFPCLVRPTRPGEEEWLAPDRAALLAGLPSWIEQAGPVLVQRHIAGGRLVCYWGYRTRHGLAVGFSAHVPRVHDGRPTACATVAAPEVSDAAVHALTILQAWGPVEVQFVHEPESGAYWLHDVQVRWAAPMDLAVAAGVDLVGVMLDDLGGGPSEPGSRPVPPGLHWVDPWHDLLARRGQATRQRLRGWLSEVRGATRLGVGGAGERALLLHWVLRRPREIMRRLAG